MRPKSSRDMAGQQPRRDEKRSTQDAIIKDAGENDGRKRDDVHGTGETINLDHKPGS